MVVISRSPFPFVGSFGMSTELDMYRTVQNHPEPTGSLPQR